MVKSILHVLNKIIDIVGWICIIAMLLMVLNVFIDVFVRYILIDVLKYFAVYDWYWKNINWLGGIGMQELEWHWFSILFLLGIGYTLRENGHVRVDVFYDKFSKKTQAIINIFGSLIFTIPFCLIMVLGDGIVGQSFDFSAGEASWGYFLSSWNFEENIGDPGSLPRLWPVKLVLPIAFTFLLLSTVVVILREMLVLLEAGDERT